MTKTDLDRFAALSSEIGQKEGILAYLKGFCEQAAGALDSDNAGSEHMLDDIATLEAEIETLKNIQAKTANAVETFISSNFGKERVLLRLRYLRGFSWEEVGAATGKTTESVKTASYRALKAVMGSKYHGGENKQGE